MTRYSWLAACSALAVAASSAGAVPTLGSEHEAASPAPLDHNQAVARLREMLLAQSRLAGVDVNRPSVELAQWPNWGNWSNWNNWQNWGNWGNWGNY
jgi:hypothetical protein